MKPKITRCLLGCSILLALPSLAYSQALMINFRGSGGPSGAELTNSPYHTADGSFEGTSWNNLSNSDSSSLTWADGTSASGISLNMGVANRAVSTVVNLSASVGAATNLGNSVNSGIYSGNSIGRGGLFHAGSASDRIQVGVQITGLAAGVYDVYITGRNTNANTGAVLPYTYYAGAGVAGENFDYSSYANESLTFQTVSGQWPGTDSWTEAGGEYANYVKLTITLSAGEALNIVSDGDGGKDQAGLDFGSANRGFLNSIQIVAVPEPSTWAAIFGLVSLGVTVFVRRRKSTTNRE